MLLTSFVSLLDERPWEVAQANNNDAYAQA